MRVPILQQLHSLKKKNGYDASETGVKTISSEMETVRRKLRELEERISKIDRLDKLEARVKALEERLQKKP
jgi:hypothetical protein